MLIAFSPLSIFKVGPVELESTALLCGSSIPGQDRRHSPSQNTCSMGVQLVIVSQVQGVQPTGCCCTCRACQSMVPETFMVQMTPDKMQ